MKLRILKAYLCLSLMTEIRENCTSAAQPKKQTKTTESKTTRNKFRWLPLVHLFCKAPYFRLLFFIFLLLAFRKFVFNPFCIYLLLHLCFSVFFCVQIAANVQSSIEAVFFF